MSPLRPRFVRKPGCPGSPTAAPAAACGRGAAVRPSQGLGLGLLTLTALTALGPPVAAEPSPKGLAGLSALSADEPPPRAVPIEAFYDVLRDHGTFIDSDRYGVLFCP